MSIETLDLKDINKKAKSVYEAVLIISKRARAITAERKSREILYEGTFETTEDVTELEEETGEEFELDVIGLCCEFAEYESLEELRIDYDNDEFQTIEDIGEHTTVIEFDGGLIVQNF